MLNNFFVYKRGFVLFVFVYLVLLILIVLRREKKTENNPANSPIFTYKSKPGGTMRPDRFKLTPVTELLSSAATRCGKRIPESRRTK